MGIEEFLNYEKENKKVSSNTIEAYKQDMYEFQRFLSSRGISSLKDATNTTVVAYLMELKNDGKAKATVNRKLSSMRAFYRFLVNNGEVKDNPTEDIKSPRIARKEIAYLTIEEVNTLLELPDDSIKGKRDRAMLEVLYATGIRVSEIVELKLSDVNMRMGFVTCNGNHAKARIVPIGTPAKKALADYIENSRKVLMRKQDAEAMDGILFANYVGEPFTRQGFWKVLKRYGEKTDFADKITPQVLRNSFAVHMVQNGIDMLSLQELMGHEDITATQVYFGVAKSRIKDAYDRTHPRA
jgi:Site-specific recombinase XerD